MTDTLEHLIPQLYDAAFDNEQWCALERAIPQALDSTSISVMAVDQARGGARFLLRSENVTQDIMQEYSAHYHRLDIWTQRAAEMALDTVFTSADLVDDTTFLRTEFYNDFIRRTETAYVVGAVWRDAEQSLWTCGIHRPLHMGNYHGDIKQRAARLLPHLKRALVLRERIAPLDIERRAAVDALEQSGLATLVAAADGRVVYANTLGEALLKAGDGLKVAVARVGAHDRAADAALLHAVRTAAGAPRTTAAQATAVRATGRVAQAVGTSIAIPRAGRRPLMATVTPFRPARDGLGFSAPAALVLIRDPERRPCMQALADLFGLTPAEARLTAGLIEHGSLTNAARAAGITAGSARQYMKRIFDKTGTGSQVELVALAAGASRT